MGRRRKPPELKVVFDTSVLHTTLASSLIKSAVAELIEENSDHIDLKLSWYLPDVVRHERQYRMEKIALELLPHIEKVERLLGNKLAITDGLLKTRVNETVETAIRTHKFNVLQVQPKEVDWIKMMLDSVYRRPPFDPGEREKGFRDALIVEAFVQLVDASPATPSRCLIVLATDDKLLGDAVKFRTSDKANVRIVTSVGELEGLINTLISKATEKFVAEFQTKASSYFFEQNDESTLYYKEGIRTRISREFSTELASVPRNDLLRKNGIWYIGTPNFLRKVRRRMYWVTKVTVEAELYKYVETIKDNGRITSIPTSASAITSTSSGTVPNVVNPFFFGPTPGSDVGSPFPAFGEAIGSLSRLFPPFLSGTRELVGKGNSLFQVEWSISISTKGRLSAPKIENINHTGTSWA